MITLHRLGKRKKQLLAVMDHIAIGISRDGASIVTRTHENPEYALDIPAWQIQSVIDRLQRVQAYHDNKRKEGAS